MNFQKRTIQYDITLEEVQRHYKAIHDAEVCMVDRLLKIIVFIHHGQEKGKRMELLCLKALVCFMAISLKTLPFFYQRIILGDSFYYDNVFTQ